MEASAQQSQRMPGGASIHYERHRPEHTTLYRLVQRHAASFIAHTDASTAAELLRFINDEFDAFLECGILANGFLRLRCGADDRQAPKQLCHYITRLALANERIRTNAAGQVVLKLKTP